MIEPEFVDDERLPLIQNYEPDIDDSVYEDTQETYFTTPLLSKMRCQLDDQYHTPAIDQRLT